MDFHASIGFVENLRTAQREKISVEVHLASGKAYSGQVTAIDEHHVVLTEDVGAQHVSALIRMEHVAVIVLRQTRPASPVTTRHEAPRT